MWEHVKKWWKGEYRPYENDPGSWVVVIGGWYERHWTSRVAHMIVDFYLDHWKWVIGIAVAIAAVVVRALN